MGFLEGGGWVFIKGGGWVTKYLRALGRGRCPEGKPRTCCRSQLSSPPARRIRCPVPGLVVFALEAIARVAFLALALLGVRVAHLLAGSHQTALGDVLTSRLHSIALLVFGRLAMSSTFVGVRC